MRRFYRLLRSSNLSSAAIALSETHLTMLCNACLAIFRSKPKSLSDDGWIRIPHQASPKEVFKAFQSGCRICMRLWKESRSYLLDKAQKLTAQNYAENMSTCYTIEPVKDDVETTWSKWRRIHLARNCCLLRRGIVLRSCGRTIDIRGRRYLTIYARKKVCFKTPTLVF